MPFLGSVNCKEAIKPLKLYSPVTHLIHITTMSYNISDVVCNSTLEAVRKADIITQSVIFCLGMPAVSLACYAVARIVKIDHITPVYVINLLIADLLQVLIKPLLIKHALERTDNNIASYFLFVLGQCGSTGFMLCITVERYVAVACPLWYQQTHTLKRSVQICLVIWIVILMITLLTCYLMSPEQMCFPPVISLVLFICVVMCYFGTWRAIRSVRSVSKEEKKRIMYLSGMIVGTYGLLFLPLGLFSIYMYIVKQTFCIVKFFVCLLVQLNPLVDPLLYILVRRDVSVQNHCCVTH